jgi:hypothetical protein
VRHAVLYFNINITGHSLCISDDSAHAIMLALLLMLLLTYCIHTLAGSQEVVVQLLL